MEERREKNRGEEKRDGSRRGNEEKPPDAV